MERYRTLRNWKSQSYCLGDQALSKARLVLVSDLNSPSYRKRKTELIDWVRRGGRLLIWDPQARAFEEPLLEGISFRADVTQRPGSRFAFAESDELLLKEVSGTHVALAPPNTFRGGMFQATSEWRELAYTVVPNTGGGQFHMGWETFGPRWTSLMNQSRIPLMLERRFGAGGVAVAQLGMWSIGAKPKMSPDRSEEAPPFLHQLARNIIAWADQSN